MYLEHTQFNLDNIIDVKDILISDPNHMIEIIIHGKSIKVSRNPLIEFLKDTVIDEQTKIAIGSNN